jgi:glucans biosynthesis protein
MPQLHRWPRRYGLIFLVTLVPLAAATGSSQASTSAVEIQAVFETVSERAESLADEAYRGDEISLPVALMDLDYDAYRQIRFRPETALWKDEGLFSVQLFHSGYLFRGPVRLHRVEDGEVTPLPFDPRRFRYDGSATELRDDDLEGAGHAGFRLHYPLNRADYHDEFLVFLGASYFRLVGRNQEYGLSARGLAIDTASPGGEEFPAFREFWLVKPAAQATQMTILALLDSPSLTGAYRFEVHPGREVMVEVESRLFARQAIDKLGIAPLTSMFAHGDTTRREVDDHRPRVHDSDGLLIHNGANEWIWRPLTNPRHLRVSSFRDDDPKGFGLVQRERDFERYLDLEARYDRRPSQWVEPLGAWGPGGVELVEIPADSETVDNIVAYWVSDTPLDAGDTRRFHYRTHTFDEALPQQRLARVERTRQGWGGVPGQPDPPPKSRRHFMIDFQGGELAGLAHDQPVEAQLDTRGAVIHDLQASPLPDGRGWRASFRLDPVDRQAIDLRLRMTLCGKTHSETWNYVWYPDEQH